MNIVLTMHMDMVFFSTPAQGDLWGWGYSGF